jgi:hypothetical protein
MSYRRLITVAFVSCIPFNAHVLFHLKVVCHHKECLISFLIVYLAEELKAPLMHGFDLLHGQVKVDAQYHDLVSLHAHHNRENDETAHYHKETEKYEGRNEEPMIEILTSLEGVVMELLNLLKRVRGQIPQ